MRNFRTQLTIPPSPWKINHETQLLSLGSCFAEHMGQRLSDRKIPILPNPFGILYNPISISNSLEMLLEERKFTPADLFQHHGLWHSAYHHGDFSAEDQATCLSNINEQLNAGAECLRKMDVLLLTFGTAHAFYHHQGGHIVANCHKLPGSEFERQLLPQQTIVAKFKDLLGRIKVIRPNLQVVITVSPVRYLRDGLVASNRSKATLLLAAQQLCEELPYANYFPAYEIVIDELRDYRFFAEDMAHPSPVAINYVWEHFQACYFEENTRELSKKIEKIRKSLAHRPTRPESEAHQKMLAQQKKAIAKLITAHPYLSGRF